MLHLHATYYWLPSFHIHVCHFYGNQTKHKEKNLKGTKFGEK